MSTFMPPQGADAGPPPQDGPVTMYTQAAIQAIHDAIAHEPDPNHKQILAVCLQNILKIQAQNASQQQAGPPGAGAALAAQMGGGQ